MNLDNNNNARYRVKRDVDTSNKVRGEVEGFVTSTLEIKLTANSKCNFKYKKNTLL